MTMLDRMRRHRNWLKWSLALVVLAFIFFYVPDFLRPRAGAGSLGEEVATVNGEGITASTFRRAYQQQMQAYRAAYGASVNEEMLKRLGVEQQILRQLIDERTAVVEARRLGLTVSDAEVVQRILSIPAFQQNGVFAGEDVYGQVLASQRPPLTKSEFEDSLRRSLLVDKLRSALTDWVVVPDADVAAEFTRRNEKAKVELVVLSAEKLRDQVTVTDQDLAKWFDDHKETYRIGEKRKIKFLLLDVEAMKTKTIVPASDVERYYREHQPEFTTPEQVRASHILLKTEGKDDATVKARAEALLKQARAGADFAELAKKNSEDEGSAKNGGDLDYFGRGRMVKEFEDAAFNLQPGQISDLVKSPFGYHIIKVVDRKPASTRPLEAARQEISDRLAYERATTEAQSIAETIAKELKTTADLDRAAAARGLKVQETGFFLKDEPIAGIGPSPEISEQAFSGKLNTVSGPARTARGLVFYAPTATESSRLPALADVKDKVREDVIREKARELTKAKAATLAAGLAGNFSQAAKAAGLDVKTSELVARGTAWPDAGISPALDAAIFAQSAGGVTAPVTTDNATVIAHVLEKQDAKPEELAKTKDTLRQELESDQRSKFFGAYMAKARDRMKININEELLRTISG
jgi:peptidyl-prolyl cis-trans isomerase D